MVSEKYLADLMVFLESDSQFHLDLAQLDPYEWISNKDTFDSGK